MIEAKIKSVLVGALLLVGTSCATAREHTRSNSANHPPGSPPQEAIITPILCNPSGMSKEQFVNINHHLPLFVDIKGEKDIGGAIMKNLRNLNPYPHDLPLHWDNLSFTVRPGTGNPQILIVTHGFVFYAPTKIYNYGSAGKLYSYDLSSQPAAIDMPCLQIQVTSQSGQEASIYLDNFIMRADDTYTVYFNKNTSASPTCDTTCDFEG